jgi:serine/threonine protein phosphatase PrpC
MEDAIKINEEVNVNGVLYSCYALMDGHGGKACAEYVRDSLWANLRDALERKVSVETALSDVFHRLDNDFFQKYPLDSSGTTVVLVLLNLSTARFWVAHVGDSRAILCRAGESVSLTQDHVVSNAAERKRVSGAGGYGQLRGIKVSRSIGDNDLKDVKCHTGFPTANGDRQLVRLQGDQVISDKEEMVTHVSRRKANVMICDPEVSTGVVGPTDEFILLVSDGLWDNQPQVDNAVLCQMARQQSTAAELVNGALEGGSTDNVSAIRINLCSCTTGLKSTTTGTSTSRCACTIL